MTFDEVNLLWRATEPHSQAEELLFDLIRELNERLEGELEEATMEDFFKRQAEWSREVFGPASVRGPVGPLKHLVKEATEAQANPRDLEEYADCLFLVFDACGRAGFGFAQLLEACWQKLEKNKARAWPATSTPADEPVEHVRELLEVEDTLG